MAATKEFILDVDTTYVVVVFLDPMKNPKKEVDLVPRSWLQVQDQKWCAYYPDEHDYQFLDLWVRENKSPIKEIWKLYEIDIVKEARKYYSYN